MKLNGFIACTIYSQRMYLYYVISNLSFRNNIEYTPLHCAVEMVSKECVEILIVHGAEVNAR